MIKDNSINANGAVAKDNDEENGHFDQHSMKIMMKAMMLLTMTATVVRWA